jgi:hypothetical protein
MFVTTSALCPALFSLSIAAVVQLVQRIGCTTDELYSSWQRQAIFLFPKSSRLTLGPIRLFIKWLRRETGHSPYLLLRIRVAETSTPTRPYTCLRSMRRDKSIFNLPRSHWRSFCDGVIGIFHWRNPSGRTIALGSTQLLSEMSTRNTSWG